MRKFLQKAALYILLAIAANFAIAQLAMHAYWKTRMPVIKKMKADGKKEISLVLGSSHTFFGVNTSLIGSNFYNMASISQNLKEDYYVLKYFSRDGVKTIILPISYFSNHGNLSQAAIDGEKIRIFDYEHAYGISYERNANYFKSKWVFYTQVLNNVIATQAAPVHALDTLCNLRDTCRLMANNISDSVRAYKRHSLFQNFQVHNPYLDSIIDLCNYKNIKLTIVVCPFTEGYKNAIKRYDTGARFEQYLRYIKQKENSNIKFIDCRDLITTQEQLYFRDADHLSPCGRAIFSSYLAKNMLK